MSGKTVTSGRMAVNGNRIISNEHLGFTVCLSHSSRIRVA